MAKKKRGTTVTAETGVELAEESSDEPEEAQGSNTVSTEGLVWRCNTCGETVEGTPATYLQFVRQHTKANGCEVHLINDQGETVATSVSDARAKGVFTVKPPTPGGKTATKSPMVKSVDGGLVGVTPGIQSRLRAVMKVQAVELNPKCLDCWQALIDVAVIPKNVTFADCVLGCMETVLLIAGYKLGVVKVDEEG